MWKQQARCQSCGEFAPKTVCAKCEQNQGRKQGSFHRGIANWQNCKKRQTTSERSIEDLKGKSVSKKIRTNWVELVAGENLPLSRHMNVENDDDGSDAGEFEFQLNDEEAEEGEEFDSANGSDTDQFDTDDEAGDDEFQNDHRHRHNNGYQDHQFNAIAVREECFNCRRQKNEDYDDPVRYPLELNLYEKDVIRFQRKFCCRKKSDIGRDIDRILLCSECRSMLIGDQNAAAGRELVDKWPAFIWKCLTNQHLISIHGEELWRFVPKLWRHWWVDVIKTSIACFGNVTVEMPEPFFVEISSDRDAFRKALDELILSELVPAVNKYLLPLVKCPWGCTEYMHRTGKVPLDVTFARYFACDIAMATKKEKTHNLKGARSDYLDTEDENLCLNPEWRVRPSIAFFEGIGPCILTCRNHDGGTKDRYLHVPRDPLSNLPANRSDQLAHVVACPRTVKSMKASKYSNSFQMMQAKGGFEGLDTFDLCNFGRFDFQSRLALEKESVILRERPDIKGRLHQLVEQKSIPSWLAQSMEDHSRLICPNREVLDQRTRGATWIRLSDAVKLQGLLTNERYSSIRVRRDQNVATIGPQPVGPETVTFVPRWPATLVWVHECDGFGAKLPSVPPLKNSECDTRALWYLCSMLAWIPKLWEQTVDCVSNDWDWHGWVLSYVTKQCLSEQSCRANGKNPFHARQTIKEMCDRIHPRPGFERAHFATLFQQHPRVQVIKWPLTESDRRIATLCDDTDVIIVYRDLDIIAVEQEIDSIPLFLQNPESHEPLFELRYMGESRSISDTINGWSSTLYGSHGGKDFPNWWKYDRGSTSTQHYDGNVANLDITHVDLLIYVRTRSMSTEALRAEYLTYIGGQNKAFCSEHNVPLILAARKHGKQCIVMDETVALPCNKKAYLECPVDECNVILCRKHFRLLDGKRTDLSAPRTTAPPRFGMPEDDNDGGGGGEFGGEHGRFGVDGTAALGSNVPAEEENPDLLVPVDIDEDVYVTGNNGYEQDCDVHNGSDELYPTTNAAFTALRVRPAAGSYIPGHTIANQCASLLVRRQGQLRGTTSQQAFLQSLVATSPGQSIPLVYPEAMIYPSIFWKATNEGAFVGALPTALLGHGATRHGIASLKDHIKTRLTNASSCTSLDPRYIFYMFDSLVNYNLRGQDTRLVLRRGFEQTQGKYAFRTKAKDDPMFTTDAVDSRRSVNRLAAACKWKQATYFLSHTCNQREHFGMKAIKRWLDSDELIDVIKSTPRFKSLAYEEIQEIRTAVVQSSAVLLTRNWQEVTEIYMSYIRHSPERPLGEVDWAFFRRENQDDKGNVDHLHAMIATKDDVTTEEGRRIVEDRIRGSIADLIREGELESLMDEGVIESYDHFCTCRTMGRQVLCHICNQRCMRRTGPSDDDLVCRVPNNRTLNPNPTEHHYKEIAARHSPDARKVLTDLGLCAPPDPNFPSLFIPKHPLLESKRHIPPADAGEGIISPCVGRLFPMSLSNSNVQRSTDYGTSRYVCKYLLKIDENNIVHVKANTHDGASLKLEYEFLHNTKITSSAINEHKRLSERRDAGQPKGRSVALTEIIALQLGYPQVYTDLNFVEIPTLPLEERCGVERVAPIKRDWDEIQNDVHGDPSSLDPDDLDSSIIASIEARERLELPRWRQHTDAENLILKDLFFSPVSVDRTTLFSVRPPELRAFVRKQEQYWRWFERSKDPMADFGEIVCSLNLNVEKSAWVDGLGFRIHVRSNALPEILDYINQQQSPQGRASQPTRSITQLFRKMADYYNNHGVSQAVEEWGALQALFVSSTWEKEHLPIPVFSTIRPTEATRFMLHLLLSMGEFDNEVELLCHETMKDAFVYAKLISDDGNRRVLEQSVDDLIRRYILEELVYMPGSTQMFDRYCVAATTILRECLLENLITMTDLPPFLYTSLRDKTNAAVEANKLETRKRLARALVENLRTIAGQPGVPTYEDLIMDNLRTNELPWDGTFQRGSQQSLASFDEQTRAAKKIFKAINAYKSCPTHFVKNNIVAGGPGNGKTFILLLALMYAMGKGLNCMSTALMSERALMLGGRHLHKLFCMPVNEGASVRRLAELAIINLLRNPIWLGFLLQLDVLAIDELGQNPAATIAVLDIVLRRIRDNTMFMGGILVITTIDPRQLPPVRGHPVLLSPHILTCFSAIRLHHSVRASQDANLRRIQAITRMKPSDYTEVIEREFKALVATYCTFVTSWDDDKISNTTLRVFGKHAGAKEAEKQFFQKIRLQHADTSVVIAKAQDLQLPVESHGDWLPASSYVSRQLDRKVKQADTIVFYPFAVMEFTYNKDGSFSQSQLGIICDVPTATQIQNFESIAIFVAPEGCKAIPENARTKDQLISLGWEEKRVGAAPPRCITVRGGLKAKRTQYGIKNRIASTIHAVMGHDVGRVATSVSTTEQSHKLWQKEQVVVLMSRTHFACEIIFVGNKDDTIEALWTLIKRQSQYAEYMEHVLDILTGETPSSFPTIDQGIHPFRPNDVAIPQDPTGYCYILLSLRDTKTTYIGETFQLVERLRQHNSGHGAVQTSDPNLRPWALLGYVCGFDGKKRFMKLFEKNWQQRRDNLRQNMNRALGPLEIAQLAPDVIQYDVFSNLELRYVQTGTIGILRQHDEGNP